MMGRRMPGLLHGVINMAMRNATAKENRRWVAPFYGDTDDYSRRLGVTDRSRVQMFLLDGAGSFAGSPRAVPTASGWRV